MSEHYCIACLQHKEAQFFKRWINSGANNARRCDSCHDTDLIKERIRKEEIERKKNGALGVPMPLTKKEVAEAEARRAVARRKIEDIMQEREDDEFVGEL